MGKAGEYANGTNPILRIDYIAYIRFTLPFIERGYISHKHLADTARAQQAFTTLPMTLSQERWWLLLQNHRA
jgi:hypothetical protein